MSNNQNLCLAKAVKNDEFYTRLEDVSNELANYKNHFRNKVVFCNCDDPSWSAFWQYFHKQFGFLKLKKLISTHYDKSKATYKMEYEGGNDNDVKAGVKTPLKGNGDFRNQECLELLDESDVVVTNPPFSLFREFFRILAERKKKFLVIAPFNAMKYKEIFPHIKDEEIWLGKTGPKTFKTPNGEDKKFGNIRWLTNLDLKRRHEKIILFKKYSAKEYPKYDNHDAVEVGKVEEIPMDYNGVMGVPITFLEKHDPDQFKVLGKISDGRVNKVRKYERLLIVKK